MRIAVLTDTHVSPPGTPDGVWNNPTLYSQAHRLLDSAVPAIGRAGVDHVIVLGDVTQFGNPDSAQAALRTVTAVGKPVHAVPGNHDVIDDARLIRDAADKIGGVTALSPHADVLATSVVAAGLEVVSADGGRTCEATTIPDALPSGPDLFILCSHYPVFSTKPTMHARGLKYPGDLLNRRRVQRLVQARSGPTLILHGHVHASTAVTVGHVVQVGCAPLVEWPHAWTLISIDDSALPQWRVTQERRPVIAARPPAIDTNFSANIASWRYLGQQWLAEPDDPAATHRADRHGPGVDTLAR